MALRAFLYAASKYLREFSRLPYILKHIRHAPQVYQIFSVSIQKLPRVIFRSPSSNTSARIANFYKSFGGANSLVKVVQNTLMSSNTENRAGSLLRMYRGLAGSVHLRHQLAFTAGHSFASINELSQRHDGSWFGSFLSSLKRFPSLPNLIHQSADSLLPKELIGVGCNSAVWAADLPESCSDSPEGVNSEVAVKVLYNYYASSNPEDDSVQPINSHPPPPILPPSCAENNESVDWVLLQRQLTRECDLRPSSGHPNIVPLIGYFFDRAPGASQPEPDAQPVQSSNTDGSSIAVLSSNSTPNTDSLDVKRSSPDWAGANEFPEAFGGRPPTYYLLMPRFDATLDYLFSGSWYPSLTSNPEANPSPSDSNGLDKVEPIITTPYPSNEQSSTSSSNQPHHEMPRPFLSAHQNTKLLAVDDAVAILAQLFDAVAELERFGVAHRDIKPNNILLRRRNLPVLKSSSAKQKSSLTNTLGWLDDSEVNVANTPFHVAITDFGCAIRTRDYIDEEIQSLFTQFFGHIFNPTNNNNQSVAESYTLAHSGNMLLLAPEIANQLNARDGDADPIITASEYARADLWTVATLAYPLFGLSNPFSDGSLSSITYCMDDLARFPDHVPGVVSWLVSSCLQRTPLNRPAADLVADVLHTWCLLRHINRRVQKRLAAFPPDSEMTTTDEEKIEHLLRGSTTTQLLDDLEKSDSSELDPNLIDRIEQLLNVCWASDWLTGPAQPPDGLRVSFYRRVTPGRLAWCLQLVHRQETLRANRVASSILAHLDVEP